MAKLAVVLTFFLVGGLTNVALAEETATVITARGKVTCGGTIDGESLQFSVIPATKIIKGEEPQGRALVFIELSDRKPDRIKIAYSFGLSTDELSKINKLKDQVGSGELADVLKWSAAYTNTAMWVGFTENTAHIEVSRGPRRALSISCQRQ